MKAHARILIAGWSSVALVMVGAGGAMASPAALTNEQLDGVTAGGATVASIVDAAAVGALALAGTSSNSVVVPELSRYPGQPNLGATAAASDGAAVAVGTNVGLPGQPAPATSTSVVTGGVADGNQVITSTFNHTVQGAGGVTLQVGWTFVYGAWVGL